MASSSVLADQVKEVGSLQSGAMGGSVAAEILPAAAPANEQASSSTPRVLPGVENYQSGTVAEQIQLSQRHWSDLSVSTSLPDSKKPFQGFRKLAAYICRGGRGVEEDKAVKMDNRKVFMELQSHPAWGHFFRTFGYTHGSPVPGKPGFICMSSGLLKVGKKFAEGAEAELFHVHITWSSARAKDLYDGKDMVMKVFKEGTLLRDLQSQWLHGFSQYVGEEVEKWKSPTYRGHFRYLSRILCGTLLEDGRFAFVMLREIEDLRRCIEGKMRSRANQDNGPFPKDEAEMIMWKIAKGMDWFHSRNIVHRDLKASNVLCGIAMEGTQFEIFIADYECSVGIVETKFFRAPEILQACKVKSVSERSELFTKAVDVYSYGMTCYEILTGNLPFEGHPDSDYDHVLSGHRPELPPYVDGWMCDLLGRCWDANPMKRPSFEDIKHLDS